MDFNRILRKFSNALSLDKDCYRRPLRHSAVDEQQTVPDEISVQQKVPDVSAEQQKVPDVSSDQQKVPDVTSDQQKVPDVSTDQQSGFVWKHLLSGATAGALSRTATAPIDHIRVFHQVHGFPPNTETLLRHLRFPVQAGGLELLWRGNGMNILKVAPETAIKFTVYEKIKHLMCGNQETGNLQLQDRIIAGSLAGAVAQTAIYPMEVMKTRLTMKTEGQYSGIADCAKQIYQREGSRAFYRGFVPSILGTIPSTGIDLAVYETLRNIWLHRSQDSANPGVMMPICCGSVSATCGLLASYPLMLVRTRMQAQATVKGAPRLSVMGTFRSIVAQKGLAGLYCGLTPSLIKVVPAVTITYVIYEYMRNYLGLGINRWR